MRRGATQQEYLLVRQNRYGYITRRNVLPNMYVEPSTRLYTVADLSRVWVYAQIFQNDVGCIKPGDTAQITVNSYPRRTFSGQIEEFLPQVDMATRTVRVRLAIANPGIAYCLDESLEVRQDSPEGVARDPGRHLEVSQG
jgi:multidrug resistance efflux pump